MKEFIVRFVLIASISIPMHAAAPYVRVLLPVYIAQPTAGAYGSLWQSEFAIHNASLSRSYTIAPCPPTEGCPLDLRDDEDLRPNETQTSLPARYPLPSNPVAGAVVWVNVQGAPVDNAENVSFQLRVVDLSRAATAAGTEIPVIREEQFRTSKLDLLNVPIDSRFRLALRVFEMNLPKANFTVRVIDQATGTVLSTDSISTNLIGVAPQGFTPAFAEINNLVASSASPRVRIEVESHTSGVAFWAYVSITNNDSQQITLVTPN